MAPTKYKCMQGCGRHAGGHDHPQHSNGCLCDCCVTIIPWCCRQCFLSPCSVPVGSCRDMQGSRGPADASNMESHVYTMQYFLAPAILGANHHPNPLPTMPPSVQGATPSPLIPRSLPPPPHPAWLSGGLPYSPVCPLGSPPAPRSCRWPAQSLRA